MRKFSYYSPRKLGDPANVCIRMNPTISGSFIISKKLHYSPFNAGEICNQWYYLKLLFKQVIPRFDFLDGSFVSGRKRKELYLAFVKTKVLPSHHSFWIIALKY